MRIVLSPSAAARLEAARRFALAAPAASELLIVSASRGAADDFARVLVQERGAAFGLYRFSLTQLAARLAAPRLARERLAPATGLGAQAVAARALFDAEQDGRLRYFGPVAAAPGFPRALARTLEELALAGVGAAAVRRAPGVGADLAELFERFDEQCAVVSAVDRAAFLRAAAEAAADRAGEFAACRLVLLDTPIGNAAERALVLALIARAPAAIATVPAGDAPTLAALRSLAEPERIDEAADGLGRVRRHLFAAAAPPPGEPIDEVELFSAPGEGREAVEIARRVLREARRGVRFDQIAIALRAPQQYASLIEHALERAGIPACFDRGTRRPDPAGRAFLAILACARENLSAARFAEYRSLAQVPAAGAPGAGLPPAAMPAPADEVFGAIAERSAIVAEPSIEDEAAADLPIRRAARAPWKWERLLAESHVVSGEARWERRLAGLVEECELQQRDLTRREPGAARLEHLARKAADLRELAGFALPVMRTLAAWPARAVWAEWLDCFESMAPRVLRRPERVLRVLADLRPMGSVGPVTLDEAARVLADRLASVETDPPRRRYGRVFIATPTQLRGRSFEVVFVPGLAERLFPQKPREDPLLLDEARAAIEAPLPDQAARAQIEQLQLRLAIGAAASRVYASFPTVEAGEGRARVPSLYALEIWRAMTGRVPGADQLQQAAALASQASLAWPAPAEPHDAIDAFEHDLSTIRALVGEGDARARGRAQYLLQLNACLQRSVRERFMRAKPSWSHWDGIVRATDQTSPILAAHRLGARRYSVSALQKYATCPYQFFLSAICRMRPAEDLEPLHRMDPLTRGSLFHAVQTAFYRRLQADGALPLSAARRDRALAVLDEAVQTVGREYHERLAPAIERVWQDEMASIRRDLRLWVDEIARTAGEWLPVGFEWAFGFQDGGALAVGRDPASRPEPVILDGRFQLHGSIDLIEERSGTGELRVTDHKTGRYRGADALMVGGGEALQPVLYSLALEQATGRPVVEGRLYFATMAGGYREIRIALTARARRAGIEALEIVDRGVERGFLAPAPAEGACRWCDFRAVCGASAERTARRKAPGPLADLAALRAMP
ncbi:MAG: PD-(D/E)XK nuclease family protein [Acidobacteria bacterium]|nr:PD-(D/E)XK nuclease family protein [Acidobacteriota bacterium]